VNNRLRLRRRGGQRFEVRGWRVRIRVREDRGER
jgi:hypothetical protein